MVSSAILLPSHSFQTRTVLGSKSAPFFLRFLDLHKAETVVHLEQCQPLYILFELIALSWR
jgi:hypothetical protein